MKSFCRSARTFMLADEGPTAVVYAVMLTLIVVVCLTSTTALGTTSKKSFKKITTAIKTSSS